MPDAADETDSASASAFRAVASGEQKRNRKSQVPMVQRGGLPGEKTERVIGISQIK